MTDATRQTKHVEREWKEKHARRVSTNWTTDGAIEDESFDIADVHLTEDDAARMGIAAAVWLGVNR